MSNERLAKWLIQRCEEQNLSWSEASRRAGVSPNTISQIVGGVQPGIRRLTELARFFDVSPEYLLRLAGHLPPRPDKGGNPVIERKLDQIRDIWEHIHALDPPLADRLAALAEMQGEMALAAIRAGERQAQEEERDTTSKPSHHQRG